MNPPAASTPVIESAGNEDPISWQVIQEGFEPSRERDMETLFAIGNGYMGVRATADFPVPSAQPDLLIAGVYDQKASALPYSEVAFLSSGDRKSVETEIVPFPSPFQYGLRIGGAELSAHTDMTSHTRTLNMKDGLYLEEHGFEDAAGRKTEVRSVRCASLVEPHLLIQRIQIQAKNYSASIELDLSNEFSDHALLYPHIFLPNPKETGPLAIEYRTHGSRIDCVMACRVLTQDTEYNDSICRFEVSPGQTIEVLRLISVFTSRESKAPVQAARQALAGGNAASIVEKIRLHTEAWHEYWSTSDVRFRDEIELTQAQRFNLYHLRIAVNDDPRVSIPAKALTGRAYEGHIFWDAEIFMFPHFLYTAPHIARNLLLYRYHTLEGAKKRAKEMGYHGACYAWESTASGEDVTPKSILIDGKDEIPIFTGTEQIHVTADVAYAIWKYWDATLDDDFLCRFGAEILAETARFWISRVSKSAASEDDAYHIFGVVGPDEYHHGVDDNAYTNWMARFNLEKAAWALGHLKDKFPRAYGELASKLHLQESDPTFWADAARQLYVPQPDEHGIIEQFQGFHALGKTRVPEHERNRAPVSRLFNWREINKLQLVKQADVLMIPFLFPNAFSKEVVAANYRYYEPLTDHGSSLSLCVHAAVAAQIGRDEVARDYWEKSLNFDLENAMSNTGLGIHAAAIGGTWQALVFHMLGIQFTDDGPVVRERPVQSLSLLFGEVTLKLNFRGTWYPIRSSGMRSAA